MVERLIRKYRSIIFIVGICTIVFFLIFYVGITGKQRIFRIVNGNLEFLNECVENGAFEESYKLKGIKRVTPYVLGNNDLVVDYFCNGFGIVPSSVYYGFYYSSGDKPVGYQGALMKLVKDGEGWSWKESGGDNIYYTEKIEGNWYYYKMGF